MRKSNSGITFFKINNVRIWRNAYYDVSPVRCDENNLNGFSLLELGGMLPAPYTTDDFEVISFSHNCTLT